MQYYRLLGEKKKSEFYNSHLGTEIIGMHKIYFGLRWWHSGKESSCNAGDTSSVLGFGRPPGGGNGNLL